MSEHFAAFVAALSEIRNPVKSRKVSVPGKYTFEYAELNGILDDARAVLGRHGLALVQPFSITDGSIALETRIIHKSGEVVLSSTSVVPAPGQPQQLGSLITYLRRYALCSALGIASVDDDDGAAAADYRRELSPSRAPQAAPPFDAAAWLRDELSDSGIPWAGYEEFLAQKGVQLAGMTREKAETIRQRLLSKPVQEEVGAAYFGAGE